MYQIISLRLIFIAVDNLILVHNTWKDLLFKIIIEFLLPKYIQFNSIKLFVFIIKCLGKSEIYFYLCIL